MLNYLKSFIVGEEPPKEGTKILISGSMDDAQDENDLEDQEEDVSPTKDQELEETKQPVASPPKEQPYHFEEYKVGVDDTLYGIALTYDINPAVLKRDNGLELDEVYSGQTLKVRVRDELPPEPEEHILPRANTAPTDLHSKENSRLSVKNRSRTVSNDLTQLEKWNVYYCTSIGDIEGVLSFESTKLVFVPVALTKTSLKSKASGDTEPSASSKEDYQNKYMSQWGAEIQVDDIAECHIMTVPGTACEEHFSKYGEYQKDYLLQIILYGHGHRSMGKYLNDLFSHMKGSKVPYACVYFKFKTDIDDERQFSNKQKQIMSHQVQNRITAIKEAIKEGGTETTDSTELHYFEFLFERFEKQDADLLRKISRKESVSRPILSEIEKERILAEINSEEETKLEELPAMVSRRSGKRMMIPKIVDESQILNLEQFTELINCVPELYQTLQWKLTYSTPVHGTSFQNLLRRTQSESPNLIVIQDENNFVFGVYTSDEIWYSDIYYGTGETFLFTFRDLNEISSFYWSKKNNLFSFVSEEGIMFGAGPHYGLWMNNELTRGRSFECETFNNPMLSYKTDFEIIKLEVWSIIDPFTSEHVPKENIVSFVDKEQ